MHAHTGRLLRALAGAAPPVLPLLLCGLALFALSPGPARAQVPATMSYQGRLTDDGGAAVPDGAHDLAFTLYDDPVAGNTLWTESQAAVPVTGGIFSVLLGSVTPLALAFDQPYWLAVSVDGGAELSPRTPLASSPYALSLRMPLPANSVDATSIVDEPGLAQTHVAGFVLIGGAGDTHYRDMLSVTITTPAAGYIVVTGETDLVIECSTVIGVQISETSHPVQDDAHYWLAGGTGSGVAPGYVPACMHRTYFKPAGTYTFYLQGRNGNFTPCIPQGFNSTLIATFLPTSYGSVSTVADAVGGGGSTSGSALEPDRDRASYGPTVDLRDLELRAAKARADAERAERELAQARLRDRLHAHATTGGARTGAPAKP